MLILFSAGNSGLDSDEDGVIDVDSLGAPGTAKNCLTVGASENDRPHGSQPPPGIDRNWNELRDRNGVLRFPQLGPAGHVSDNPDGMAAFSLSRPHRRRPHQARRDRPGDQHPVAAVVGDSRHLDAPARAPP
jgi:hypothetical protein